jgi:hypothetical protein
MTVRAPVLAVVLVLLLLLVAVALAGVVAVVVVIGVVRMTVGCAAAIEVKYFVVLQVLEAVVSVLLREHYSLHVVGVIAVWWWLRRRSIVAFHRTWMMRRNVWDYF